MDFAQLRAKYPNVGQIGRKDLADNLEKHRQDEINGFCAETKLSYGQALNLFSPPPEEYTSGNRQLRPADAMLDCIAYMDLRVVEENGIPASPACEFFDRDEAQFSLGVGYLQNLFQRRMGLGIDRDVQFAREYSGHGAPIVDSAANNRSGLTRPFDPENTGPTELQRNYAPRVRIANVIAFRRTVLGSKYEVPILESPDDTGIRIVGEGADLPRWVMKTGEETIRTAKIGYEFALTDELQRSATITMDAVAENQAQKSRQTENAIVNSIIELVANGAAPFAMSASPTVEEIVKLHMTPDDNYMITTLIGVLNAVVKYAIVDYFYQSGNAQPTFPMNRSFVDSILGNEFIAKKSDTDVPSLAGGDKMVAWDRRIMVDYVVEQRSSIQETYREHRQQQTVISNSINFATRLKAEKDNCRYLITMASE